jgi:hypothetical protein
MNDDIKVYTGGRGRGPHVIGYEPEAHGSSSYEPAPPMTPEGWERVFAAAEQLGRDHATEDEAAGREYEPRYVTRHLTR